MNNTDVVIHHVNQVGRQNPAARIILNQRHRNILTALRAWHKQIQQPPSLLVGAKSCFATTTRPAG